MTKKPFPSEQQERFIIRLPDGMRDRIAEEAKKNNRSMNAEIVHRLEKSFDPAEPTMDEIARGLRDIAMNMMTVMTDKEFDDFLDRVKNRAKSKK